MIMYLGSEGLEGYLKLQSDEIAETDPHAGHYQKCLMISFEDRNYLQKEDIQLIKKLGLKFRGRNEWPLFRSDRSGYLPWFLTEKEALFLTVAIEQAVDVALRFKEDRNLLTAPDEDEYLMRVPDKIKNVLLWENKWMKPVPVENTRAFDDRVDEVRIQKIKKGASRTGSIWKIEFTFAPMPVREKKERLDFPKMFAVMDHRSMMALDLHMFERGNASNYCTHCVAA